MLRLLACILVYMYTSIQKKEVRMINKGAQTICIIADKECGGEE